MPSLKIDIRTSALGNPDLVAFFIKGSALPAGVPPEEFDAIGNQVRKLGFKLVASGPFVRSSYHAGEMASALA